MPVLLKTEKDQTGSSNNCKPVEKKNPVKNNSHFLACLDKVQKSLCTTPGVDLSVHIYANFFQWLIFSNLFDGFGSYLVSESELFTGDTSKDNHSPGPVFREVSP